MTTCEACERTDIPLKPDGTYPHHSTSMKGRSVICGASGKKPGEVSSADGDCAVCGQRVMAAGGIAQPHPVGRPGEGLVSCEGAGRPVKGEPLAVLPTALGQTVLPPGICQGCGRPCAAGREPAPYCDHAEAKPEVVNHPAHYNSHPSGVEAIDICEHYGFSIGNVIKYCWRAGLKGDGDTTEKRLEDLRKGRWYLDREITRLEKRKVK